VAAKQRRLVGAVGIEPTTSPVCEPVRLPHSGLIWAVRMTLPHFSVSSAMTLAKSAGEPGNAVPPMSANRALIFGSARPALTSLLSRVDYLGRSVPGRADAVPRACLIAGHE